MRWLSMLVAFVAAGLLLSLAPAHARAQDADPHMRTTPEYHLGSGDKLRILVYNEPTLSGEFLVNGSGAVAFPLVGDLKAVGLSTAQFQDEIRTALADGYIKEPRVNVEVMNYRPFYILGEVNKPGEYPYTNGLNVFNAVATANGFTYRANTKKVFIRRANSTEEKPYPLNSETTVAPGDTIRISERYF